MQPVASRSRVKTVYDTVPLQYSDHFSGTGFSFGFTPRSSPRKQRVFEGMVDEEDVSNYEDIDRVNFQGRSLGEREMSKTTVSESTRIMDLSYNNLHSVTFLPQLLCVLTVAHNNLTDLADLSLLVNLQELDASFNKLVSLRGLHTTANKLVTINVSHNSLYDIVGVELMVSLKHLDISHNIIDKQIAFRPMSCCKCLSELRFNDNPVISLRPQLRQQIMDWIPSLLMLNDNKIGSSPSVTSRSREWSYSTLHRSRYAKENTATIKQELDICKYSAGPARQIALVETSTCRDLKPTFSSNKILKTPEKNRKSNAPQKSWATRKSTIKRSPSERLVAVETLRCKSVQQETRSFHDPKTMHSTSALDWIGTRAEICSTGDLITTHSVSFDDEFEISEARKVVEERNYSQRCSFSSNKHLPSSPSHTPVQGRNPHSSKKPLSQMLDCVNVPDQRSNSRKKSPSNSSNYMESSSGLSDEVVRRLRQLVDQKKKNLHDLTQALSKFH